jgi:hypothetical protein
VRATEKFNNRRDEFGMMLSVLKTTASTLKQYPSEGTTVDDGTETPAPVVDKATPKPYATALGIYGTYGHLFVGSVESYNEARHGFHAGLGGLFATGYLAPAFRAGWDIFLGRRFSTSFSANYVASATILVDDETVTTKGGAGGDVIMSLNF